MNTADTHPIHLNQVATADTHPPICTIPSRLAVNHGARTHHLIESLIAGRRAHAGKERVEVVLRNARKTLGLALDTQKTSEAFECD